MFYLCILTPNPVSLFPCQSLTGQMMAVILLFLGGVMGLKRFIRRKIKPQALNHNAEYCLVIGLVS